MNKVQNIKSFRRITINYAVSAFSVELKVVHIAFS